MIAETKREAIKRRKSVRTYTPKELSPDDIKSLKNSVNQLGHQKGPLGHHASFYYIPVNNNIAPDGEKIGTYGVIKKPSGYVVSKCKNTKPALIDLGYIFESLIIDLTAREIGTCWLGGTFKKMAIENQLEIDKSEVIPAISPVGYYQEKERFMGMAMRRLVGADSKKQWASLFYKDSFEQVLEKSDVPLYEDAFEAVRLGPSASNKQPWRLVYHQESQTVDFILEHTPNYGGASAKFDMQYIDIGIAMYHFECVSVESGYQVEWTVKETIDYALANSNQEYISTLSLSV